MTKREWILSLGLVCILVAGLIACLFIRPPAHGPSAKFVKFKNKSGGPRVLAGMDVDESRSAHGSTIDDFVKHGFPDVLNEEDETGGKNRAVPWFAMSYVFNFELDDGTKFENAPCVFEQPMNGFDIIDVVATLTGRDQDGTRVYDLEFEITYDDYPDWPGADPARGLQAPGVKIEGVVAGTTRTWLLQP